MRMPRPILMCEELMSEVCDRIGAALNESASEMLSDDLSDLVEITTRNYKKLLLTIMFEEGEKK